MWGGLESIVGWIGEYCGVEWRVLWGGVESIVGWGGVCVTPVLVRTQKLIIMIINCRKVIGIKHLTVFESEKRKSSFLIRFRSVIWLLF